jgi:hypothetical protein
MTCQVCSGAIPDGVKVQGHTALCAEAIRQENERMRRDWLSLLRGIWPVDCEQGSFVPACRYCGSTTDTPDGQELVHAETCAWDRVKRALDAEKLSPGPDVTPR